MEKRLYRNEHDKILSGVSSGLAEYLGYDVLLIRILFVVSAPFTAFATLLAYIILWIVVPINNDPAARYSKFDAFNNLSNSGEQTKWNTQNAGPNFTMPNNSNFNTAPKNIDTGRTVAGLVILVLGVYFLLKQFIFIPVWFSIFKLWPLVIVAVGISLIFKNKRRNEWEQFKKETKGAQKSTTEKPVEEMEVKPENSDSGAPTV